MKKFVSIALVLVMVLSMATVAFANETPAAPATASTRVDGTAAEELTFYFEKEYIGNCVDAKVFPAEELTFAITDSTDANAPELTVAKHTIDSNSDAIAITVGAAEVAGVYNYTIKENKGTAQGVVYSGANTAINVTVWVYWNEIATDNGTTRELVKSVTFTKPETGEKVDTIVNEYNVNNLTVTKNISGSLASTEVAFDMTVAFAVEEGKTACSDITYTVADGDAVTITAAQLNEGYVANIALAAGESAVFSNIPDGVYYTIKEDDKHILAEGDTLDPNDPTSGYTATYNGAKTQLNEDASETVLNEKDTEVKTGISMDTVPYIVVMAVAVMGLVAVVANKRRAAEF